MLSHTASESAYQLAAELDGKGIAVVAKPGSLLSKLVAMTAIDYNPQITEGGFHIDLGRMSALTDAPSATMGFSEHSARMEETADFLAKQMQDYLLHARTIAAPWIDELAKRLGGQLELIEGAPDAGVNIKVSKTNNILTDTALYETISRSKEVVYESLKHTTKLPEMSDAMVRSSMATGSPLLDASVLEYFSAYPEGWLASNFSNVFRYGCSDISAESGLDVYLSGRHNVPVALMAFLVARRLWNAPPDGTDMPLESYEAIMTDIRNQAALRLCQEVDRMVRDGKNGILVTGTRSVMGTVEVEVNQEQYNEYIKNGGSVDALLGNQLQSHPKVLTKDILADKAIYEAAWQRHYSLNKSYYDQRRLLRMREAVLIEWDQLTKESTHEEFSLADRHVARALVRRMAECLRLCDFDNISELAMNLACKTRFRDTAAYDILSGMARAKKNNPGINSREAATISVLEYLYGWVGDNMTVVSANKVNVFSPQDTQL